jgi:glycosyltransferase involved in cell wall biosynthesis
MRIGMMADAYKPHVSGITSYISIYKQSLEAAGHDVYVFTFGGDETVDDERNVIRTRGLPLVDTGLFISIRYSTQAQKLLRSMDLVHVHHPFTSGQLAIRYCKPEGIPLVFTNHTRYDLYAQAYLPMVPEALGDAFLRAYLPPFCRACDLVIAPSAGLREVLFRLGVDMPIEVVPNGVDIEPFRSPEKRVARKELGFTDSDIVLTYMGRLGPEKNLVFLMRAFGGLAKTYEQVKLLIIGDGPERENLIDRARYMDIADQVVFTGMIPYADLPGYLHVADAFVTASVTEVHPLSVIEAMASGLPVVGIQSPGVGDIVEDGVTGFLAPEEDLAVFTAKMTRMVTDGDCRAKMSQQAREAVKAYAIEYTTKNLLGYYQRLVDDSARRKRGFWSRLLRRVAKGSP